MRVNVHIVVKDLRPLAFAVNELKKHIDLTRSGVSQTAHNWNTARLLLSLSKKQLDLAKKPANASVTVSLDINQAFTLMECTSDGFEIDPILEATMFRDFMNKLNKKLQ